MTKEAKLTAAMRILPEWKGFDEDIRRLQQKIDSGVLDPESEEQEESDGVNLDTITQAHDVHIEL